MSLPNCHSGLSNDPTVLRTRTTHLHRPRSSRAAWFFPFASTHKIRAPSKLFLRSYIFRHICAHFFHNKNCSGERCPMLACKRLRIDPCDGSPVVDYRILNGWVERHTLETVVTREERWQRLTPEQLSCHVMANTVVAQWLSRRMGVHRLIRACNPSAKDEVQERTERIAA